MLPALKAHHMNHKQVRDTYSQVQGGGVEPSRLSSVVDTRAPQALRIVVSPRPSMPGLFIARRRRALERLDGAPAGEHLHPSGLSLLLGGL